MPPRARWDGNTLVIETTNFTDRTSIGDGNGLRHSAEREEDAAITADLKKGIVRKRKSIQQNLDAGARPIPGRANPNDDVDGN